MQASLNGRPVEITSIVFERDVCDSYVESAYYTDSDTELTEEELTTLSEETDLSAEHAEYWQCAAEDWYDLVTDR